MEQYNKWKKNTLEEINSRVNEAEQINEWEDKSRGNHYWEAENRKECGQFKEPLDRH